MKNLRMTVASMAMVLLAGPAFAVDTTRVYSSGILVLIFLGICALFVVSQMIPAIILLLGTIKNMVKARKLVAVTEKENLG